MRKLDSRLPEMSSGLGVIEDHPAKFYPLKIIKGGIIDDLGGRPLKVAIDENNSVPYAMFEEKDDSTPLQIFTRLYGFSYSYPGSGFTIRGVLYELGGPEVFDGQDLLLRLWLLIWDKPVTPDLLMGSGGSLGGRSKTLLEVSACVVNLH